MEPLRRFFNMKTAVVDLSDGSLEVLPLSPDLIAEKMGGAAVNRWLYSRYSDLSPLVLGTGPLTGSLAPASCLLVATFRSPDDNKLCHTPLLFRAGPELKFSGFDFVVIKGACSQSAGVLYLGDGAIRLVSAEGLRALTVPEAEAALRRRDPASHRFVVMTGPAADQGSPYAAVGMGLGGSLDKTGLARWMGSRNLKALVLNGNGGLPFDGAHLGLRRAMLDRLSIKKKHKGARRVLKRMAPDWNGKILPSGFSSRHLACYGCPFPCTSHITPRNSAHSGAEDHGFVLHDHVGFNLLLRRFGPDAPRVMNACVRLGLDPAAFRSFFPKKGKIEDLMKNFLQLEREKDEDNREEDYGQEREGYGALPKGVSQAHHRLFGGGLPPLLTPVGGKRETAWERRVAAAMTMGICPVFLLLFPDVGTEDMLRFFPSDREESVRLRGALESSIESVLSQEKEGIPD